MRWPLVSDNGAENEDRFSDDEKAVRPHTSDSERAPLPGEEP